MTPLKPSLRTMPKVEIRIPTYRRAGLLKRALASLLSQTEGDWVAIVLDDSPDRDGREVIAQLRDPRILYRPNATRLGCAVNLDQAFATESYAGAAYACVLEDDNWFLPEFLASNMSALERSGFCVLLRNQQIVWEGQGIKPFKAEQTTRGAVFSEGALSV